MDEAAKLSQHGLRPFGDVMAERWLGWRGCDEVTLSMAPRVMLGHFRAGGYLFGIDEMPGLQKTAVSLPCGLTIERRGSGYECSLLSQAGLDSAKAILRNVAKQKKSSEGLYPAQIQYSSPTLRLADARKVFRRLALIGGTKPMEMSVHLRRTRFPRGWTQFCEQAWLNSEWERLHVDFDGDAPEKLDSLSLMRNADRSVIVEVVGTRKAMLRVLRTEGEALGARSGSLALNFSKLPFPSLRDANRWILKRVWSGRSAEVSMRFEKTTDQW